MTAASANELGTTTRRENSSNSECQKKWLIFLSKHGDLGTCGAADSLQFEAGPRTGAADSIV